MKKLSLLFFALLSVFYYSCDKNNDDDDNDSNSDLFGVWNVVETINFRCDTTDYTLTYNYQITIDEWGTDSLIITNFNETNYEFYGFATDNSLTIEMSTGECDATAIRNDNTLNFNTVCRNIHFANDYNAIGLSNCNPGNTTYTSNELIATKQ